MPDPINLGAGADFTAFSDAAIANLERLLEVAIESHRDAVNDLADLLASTGAVKICDLAGVEARYDAIARAKRRIDIVAMLREKAGVWS